MDRARFRRISAEDRKEIRRVARFYVDSGRVKVEANRPIREDGSWNAEGSPGCDGQDRLEAVWVEKEGSVTLDVCVLKQVGQMDDWEPQDWLYPQFVDGKLAGFVECPYCTLIGGEA